jgi:hypothetical protein
VVTGVDRTHDSAAAPRLRRRPDRPHAALIAVSAAYCLLVLLRTPQSMTLTFDEVVYASQLSADAHAVGWSPHRARGMPLLLGPVVMVTHSVVALRVYVTLGSAVLMYLAFLPWLALFTRAGSRFRYVPAVAAGCFGTLWVTELFATMAYPNLWLAFLLVAGAGYFARASLDPTPAWRPAVGVFAAFAVASLIRPTDASFAAVPLLLTPLVVRGWRRPEPAVAVVGGLLVGWASWAGDAFARFGGPVERLRTMAESTGSGLANALPANLDAVDGPRLLCRPASDCAGIDPAAAAWWVLLPVLVAAGLAVAARTGWFGAGALATTSAVAFAVPYLLLLDYTSPRFLLAAYGLLAVPVAGLLVWLTGLGARPMRTVVTAAVVGVLLLHVAVQQEVLETVRGRMEKTYGGYARLAEFLQEEQGVRPPCLVWGEGALPLSYPLKCRSETVSDGPAPDQDDPVIAAALARGDTVVVRIRADEDPPPFMAGWRRVDLPVTDTYVGYLSPPDR